MIVQQTSTFKRQTKKSHKAEKSALDRAIKQVIKDPSVGGMKTGDLAGIQAKGNLYLFAYECFDNRLLLTLISHGTHENFYRNLKRN